MGEVKLLSYGRLVQKDVCPWQATCQDDAGKSQEDQPVLPFRLRRLSGAVLFGPFSLAGKKKGREIGDVKWLGENLKGKKSNGKANASINTECGSREPLKA